MKRCRSIDEWVQATAKLAYKVDHPVGRTVEVRQVVLQDKLRAAAAETPRHLASGVVTPGYNYGGVNRLDMMVLAGPEAQWPVLARRVAGFARRPGSALGPALPAEVQAGVVEARLRGGSRPAVCPPRSQGDDTEGRQFQPWGRNRARSTLGERVATTAGHLGPPCPAGLVVGEVTLLDGPRSPSAQCARHLYRTTDVGRCGQEDQGATRSPAYLPVPVEVGLHRGPPMVHSRSWARGKNKARRAWHACQSWIMQ